MFRETKIGFFISAVLGNYVIISFDAQNNELKFAILWSLLNLAVFHIIAFRKFLKINKFLDNCDLENFTANCEKMLKTYTKIPKGPKRGITAIMLNLSTAYLWSGNSAAAAKILLMENYFFPNNKAGTEREFIYHNNLFRLYMQENDIPKATQALTQMEQILLTRKLTELDKHKYFNMFAEKRCMLNMANGNYDGCEQIFELAYEKGISTLSKVSAKYNLGKIYLHYGRTSDAKEAFEYVVSQGGSTYCKKKAIEQLEILAGAISVPPANELTLEDKQTVQMVESQAVKKTESKNRVFRMNMQERKQYNLVITVLFIVFFVLYGAIGALVATTGEYGPFLELPPLLRGIVSALISGFMGGYLIAGSVSGIWLGCRFISRSKWLIILACIFFMFSVPIFHLVGFFVTIPFVIYNAVLLRRSNELRKGSNCT
jgi:tetratricopeptide (TPR) repeat protein